MASVQINLNSAQQPSVDPALWPLVVWLEPSTSLAVSGDYREVAAWARTFASALSVHADEMDAAAAQAAADLAASRADAARLRVDGPIKTHLEDSCGVPISEPERHNPATNPRCVFTERAETVGES